MQTHFLIFILAILSLTSCKSKQAVLENDIGEKLIIGHGGGFSGHTIEYHIFQNGRVIRKNSLNNTTDEMKPLSNEVYAQIVSNFKLLGLEYIELNQPDNMYYYIIDDVGGKTHKLVWNTNDISESQEKMQLFFNTVLHRIKN